MFHEYRKAELAKSVCWRGFCGGVTWEPLLEVSIVHQGNESRRLQALVDSGSQVTLFEATIGERLGIPVKDGPTQEIVGATGVADRQVYFHDVQLKIGSDSIRIRAGFYYGLPIPAILGRYGFFDHFKVIFDPQRGGMSIERVPPRDE